MRAMMLPVVLVALGPSVGVAQTAVPIPVGSVVRVSTDCRQRTLSTGKAETICRRERGVLVGSDSEGLTWRPGAESPTEARPWSAIRSVEVSQGKRRHAVTGMWIGAVAGVVPGALAGAWAAGMCECGSPNYAGGAVIGAVIFAVPAGLLGAGIGALVQSERWESVSPAGLGLSLTPRGEGLGVGLNVRF